VTIRKLVLKTLLKLSLLNRSIRKFFKTYKEHYEKFWHYLANDENGFRNLLIDNTKENKELKEKPIRDFVKNF